MAALFKPVLQTAATDHTIAARAGQWRQTCDAATQLQAAQAPLRVELKVE